MPSCIQSFKTKPRIATSLGTYNFCLVAFGVDKKHSNPSLRLHGLRTQYRYLNEGSGYAHASHSLEGLCNEWLESQPQQQQRPTTIK